MARLQAQSSPQARCLLACPAGDVIPVQRVAESSLEGLRSLSQGQQQHRFWGRLVAFCFAPISLADDAGLIFWSVLPGYTLLPTPKPRPGADFPTDLCAGKGQGGEPGEVYSSRSRGRNTSRSRSASRSRSRDFRRNKHRPSYRHKHPSSRRHGSPSARPSPLHASIVKCSRQEDLTVRYPVLHLFSVRGSCCLHVLSVNHCTSGEGIGSCSPCKPQPSRRQQQESGWLCRCCWRTLRACRACRACRPALCGCDHHCFGHSLSRMPCTAEYLRFSCLASVHL